MPKIDCNQIVKDLRGNKDKDKNKRITTTLFFIFLLKNENFLLLYIVYCTK